MESGTTVDDWQTVEHPAVNDWQTVNAPEGSALSRFGHGLYESTVAPVVQAVSHPIDTAVGLGKQVVGYDALHEIADHVKAGNYGKAADAALDFATTGPVGRIGHAIVQPVVDDVKQGNLAGAAGRVVGNAATVLAPEIAASAPIRAATAAVGRGIKTTAVEGLGMTTGAGSNAIKQALERPTPDLLNAMRGNTTDTEVLSHFKDALDNVKTARSADYQAKLAQLPATSQVDIAPVHNALQGQLSKFGIKAGPNGELDFSRSAIRDKAAQAEVNSIAEDLKGWGTQPGDLTPGGVDILKRRIDDTYSPSSAARSIVQNVKDAARSALNDQVPGYSDMTKGYATASEFIDHLKDLSLDSKNPGTAIRKLTTTLKANNGYREALTDALSQYAGKDLRGELAGMNLSRMAPRGLAGPSTGLGILASIAGHVVSPASGLALAMASPRLMGELMAAMSKVKAGAALPAVGPVARATPISLSAAQLRAPVLQLPKAAQNDSQNPVIAGIQQ